MNVRVGLCILFVATVSTACGGGGTSSSELPDAPGDETETTQAPDVSYPSPLNVERFVRAPDLLPLNEGGAATSWTVSPRLPLGLSLDGGTGAIGGIPTEFRAAATYTVTATNRGGADTFDLLIDVAFGSLRLEWPMPGMRGVDWVINNYVDLDPSPGGMRDYAGNTGTAAKVYDGHQGVDVDCSTFRAMDDDFPIYAADEGVVVGLEEGQPDRNIACAGTWNYVTLEHPNGWRTTYGHLKQNSVVVTMGQQVRAGDTLGVMGSSGCSTAPHLHLEVRNATNAIVDPFLDGLWLDPPSYEAPFDLMELSLQSGVPTWRDLKDPGPDLTSTAPGTLLAAKLSMAGGEPSDAFEVRWLTPSGATHGSWTNTFGTVYRHTYWYATSTVTSAVGTWKVEVRLNGVLKDSLEFVVTN